MSKVFVSSVILAPVQQVWSKIRDFNGLPHWLPAVGDSRIEDGDPSDRVGCVRDLTLTEGRGTIRERLLALNDVGFSCTYCILDSPMPMRNYVATLRLRPITDRNETYAEWTATFDCAPEDEAELIDLIGRGVYQSGFDSLQKHFGA